MDNWGEGDVIKIMLSINELVTESVTKRRKEMKRKARDTKLSCVFSSLPVSPSILFPRYLLLLSFPSLSQPHGLWPTRLLCPWDLPGKNTEMCCHFLLQGNLPNPAIKLMSPGCPVFQADSLPLSYLISPVSISM